MITAPTENQKFTIRTELLADLLEAELLHLDTSFKHWDGEVTYAVYEEHILAKDADELPKQGRNTDIWTQDEMEQAEHIFWKRRLAKKTSGVLVSPNS
jgi:hypothetical protein